MSFTKKIILILNFKVEACREFEEKFSLLGHTQKTQYFCKEGGSKEKQEICPIWLQLPTSQGVYKTK